MKKYNQGYIYLIGESNNPNIFKIGFTRNLNVEERKKELQTGNSNELYIKHKYFSNRVNKLEKMLHLYYAKYNTLNEWFELPDNEVNNFLYICDKYQKIIDSLKDNPFF